MSVETRHTPWTPIPIPTVALVAHRWFARFHSLVQRTLGSMMKLNWGNFARHRESWLAMMMMISMMMMMMMAAINSVIHKHQQQQQLACSVGRLVAAPSSCSQPGLGLNPILVPLSHSSVWDFNSNFFSPVFGRNESECKFFNVAFWFV